MKIALVGTRGVPARYGGFETCAEELALALAGNGHRVLVTNRRYLYPGRPRSWRGIRLRYPPSIPGKITDTFSHTFFGMVEALAWEPDAILLFNAANSPLAFLARAAGRKIAINVDGLEWRRRKWGPVARAYYRFAEFCSCLAADEIVSDARAIADYYRRKFGRGSTFIPYGAPILEPRDPSIPGRYGLAAGKYFFIASRLEPENHQDVAVEAFAGLDADTTLAVAGGANWKSPFVARLRKSAGPRVRFLGPVYEPGHIEELHCRAFAYIHGNEVGGTNPALLKAMGSGNCILALDVPFNREVLGDAGLYFRDDPRDLRAKAAALLADPAAAADFGRRARERARALYTWPAVAADYERLFLRMTGRAAAP